MPRKSMKQGYKISNRTDTGRRTARTGGQSPKGSILFPYPWKKGEYEILSWKNNDRHPYDKRNEDTATQLNLQIWKIWLEVSSKKWLLIETNNFAINQIYRIMYSSEYLESFFSVPKRGFASWRLSPIILCQEQSSL